jgi:hypothetical protein
MRMTQHTSSYDTGAGYLARVLLDTAAIIVQSGVGGPIADYIGMPKIHPRGSFSSVKTGRGQLWEADHHRAMILCSEADANVVHYLSEGVRFEMNTTHGLERGRPDLIRLLADGTVEVIETKKDKSEVEGNAELADRLRLIENVCDLEGWDYRLMFKDEIMRGYTVANANQITLDRTTSVTSAERIRLIQAIADGGGWICYGEAIAALSTNGNFEDGAARAKLHALIVRRVASVDISKPIDLYSAVHLADPCDDTIDALLERRLHR